MQQGHRIYLTKLDEILDGGAAAAFKREFYMRHLIELAQCTQFFTVRICVCFAVIFAIVTPPRCLSSVTAVALYWRPDFRCPAVGYVTQ